MSSAIGILRSRGQSGKRAQMTSVSDLFSFADVPYAGVVSWGDAVPLVEAGVYVVSTSGNSGERDGPPDCPLNLGAIDLLLDARPRATIDSRTATPGDLAARLQAMWPSGEPVVYIGLAGTNTRHRVNQFYRTTLGARAPHAGGWPVKVLDSTSLWIHYGPTADAAQAEAAMIKRFAKGVPHTVARELIDPTAPLPFANLTFPGGRRKSHGLRGFTLPRSSGNSERDAPQPDRKAVSGFREASDQPVFTASMARYTQNITESDIDKGQLRVPRASKSIFPPSKARIEIEMDGNSYTASWDPRTDGSFERSGVIRVGKAALGKHIIAGGPRRLETTATGYKLA